jgi:hypothetical protein
LDIDIYIYIYIYILYFRGSGYSLRSLRSLPPDSEKTKVCNMGDAGGTPEGNKNPFTLRVAIIGGGPAGLGAAIALSALPPRLSLSGADGDGEVAAKANLNVQVRLYERAGELREFGAGIRIGYNCWRVLEALGLDAADEVKGHHKRGIVHRWVFFFFPSLIVRVVLGYFTV